MTNRLMKMRLTFGAWNLELPSSFEFRHSSFSLNRFSLLQGFRPALHNVAVADPDDAFGAFGDFLRCG